MHALTQYQCVVHNLKFHAFEIELNHLQYTTTLKCEGNVSNNLQHSFIIEMETICAIEKYSYIKYLYV